MTATPMAGTPAGPVPASRAGQPSTVAIDVGGTSMKGALVAADGAVLTRVDTPTPAAAGGAAVLAAVLALARRLAAAAAEPTVVAANGGVPVRVVAVAAITPGHVYDGLVKFAANIGWRDVPLAAELSAALGVPAAVEHDAAGAAHRRGDDRTTVQHGLEHRERLPFVA